MGDDKERAPSTHEQGDVMASRAEKDEARRERDRAMGVSTHEQNVWRRVGGARQMIHAPERGADVILSVKKHEDGSVWIEMCKLHDSGIGIAAVTQVELSSDAREELWKYLGP